MGRLISIGDVMERLFQGDSREILTEFEDCLFDSVITDPPYELGFMGKTWDSTGIAYSKDFWAECLRILKPGGHLIAFSGARTYHRMTVAIEDAGFEIRDMLQWIYGAGFPKGQDISKALDKKLGVEREVIGKKNKLQSYGQGVNNVYGDGPDKGHEMLITAPGSEEAKQWEGWNTTLKPAHEPICFARKPIEGTMVENILKWGCGGINIDACRVPGEYNSVMQKTPSKQFGVINDDSWKPSKVDFPANPAGRWPSDVILGHSPDCGEVCVEGCPVKLLNEQSGNLINGTLKAGPRKSPKTKNSYGKSTPAMEGSAGYGDQGGASKYFIDLLPDPFLYCGKATQKERAKSKHPTIKPLKLMSYLVKMVTPKGGLCLDPFLGSGTTMFACIANNIDFIGIDLDLTECKTRIENIDPKVIQNL